MADQVAPIVFDYRWRWRMTGGTVLLLGSVFAGLAAINSWKAALVILGVFAILAILGIGFQVYRVAVVGDQLEVCRLFTGRRRRALAALEWGLGSNTISRGLRRGIQPSALFYVRGPGIRLDFQNENPQAQDRLFAAITAANGKEPGVRL